MPGVDFERIRDRYAEFWARENHDRPLIAAYAPRTGTPHPVWADDVPVERRWLDVEAVVRHHRREIESTVYVGEAFPAANPNLGPDFLGAVMGCELSFGKDTSWAHPVVERWDAFPKIRFDPGNPWWKRMTDLTRALMEDSHGDYLVGVTDLHPGLDGLVALRGPELLCLDLLDEPDAVVARTWQVLEVFREVFSGLHGMTATAQGGTTHWLGLFHPGRSYTTSCDFACLISGDDFESFVVPELRAELAFLDASIFHLDGPGALRHLDRLLAIPELSGVQWVPGAGGKPMKEWLPVLRRIQTAGKRLQISLTPDDLLPVCRALRPEGVQMSCYFGSESEACDAIREVERIGRLDGT